MTLLKKFSFVILASGLLISSCKKDKTPPVNAAPVASAVTITGLLEVDKTLTATYTYTDGETDAESVSTFKWYVANDAAGAGETAITGATSLTYILQAAEQGKYIRFGVTPKAATGTATGTEVKSAFFGAVGEATTVTFTYNGASVTYNVLTSAASGRKWLDRNLGASNVASSINDFANYGDLFQWGRKADGHQITTHSGTDVSQFIGVNGITSTTSPFELSETDDPGHAKYIIDGGGTYFPWDWRATQNNDLWQGVNGINNPCPSGFRVPTLQEWVAEGITSMSEGFTKLKLPLTGIRFDADGVYYSSDMGCYWTSSIAVDDKGTNKYATMIMLQPDYTELAVPRAVGNAVRCIKN